MGAKNLAVAIVLGAVDNMSRPTAEAVGKTQNSINGLRGSSVDLGQAAALGAAGYGLLRTEMGFVDKFATQQSADTQVRIREMNQLGQVNEAAYNSEIQLSKRLSQQYSKSITEYDAMISTLRRNRISAKDIVEGIGETTAQLSLAFGDLDPNKGALFFARLKNDMHVTTADMGKMANMAYKLFQSGVGENAEDSVHQLTEAYAKAGLGALNLGLHGQKDAEDLGILMGTFIAKGISGQSVGNNFRRIFDGMTDPKKMEAVNEEAAKIGMHLQFFDEKGQFKGIENFRKELAKLKGQNAQTIGGILQPFSGKQGLSVDFLENMSKYGEDADILREQYNAAADLNNSIKELTKTLTVQKSVLRTNADNMEAAFGRSMQDDVKHVISLLNEMTIGAQHFAEKHPDITRVALEFAGIAGSAAGFAASMRTIGLLIPGVAAAAGTISTAFLGIGASALLFKEFVEGGSKKAHEQIAKNPTGDRERIMKGYETIIENPETGFFKRNAARAMKAGIAWNIDLFGDDKARPDVDLSNGDSKEKIIADLARHRVEDNNAAATYWNNYYAERTKARELQQSQTFPWFSGPNGGQGGNSPSKVYGSDVSKQPDFTPNTYAPVNTVNVYGANTLSAEDISKMLDAKDRDNFNKIMKEMERRKNLTYGGAR